MSPQGADPGINIHGFPRVSGDEPADVAPSAAGYAFSPRERG